VAARPSERWGKWIVSGPPLAYLLVFSVGMCSLLIGAALAADTTLRLPRAGPWMLWVKRAFALILLGVAEYYLVQMGTLLI